MCRGNTWHRQCLLSLQRRPCPPDRPEVLGSSVLTWELRRKWFWTSHSCFVVPPSLVLTWKGGSRERERLIISLRLEGVFNSEGKISKQAGAKKKKSKRNPTHYPLLHTRVIQFEKVISQVRVISSLQVARSGQALS